MTDIVERLRQGVDPDNIQETEAAMDRAADEIESLRKQWIEGVTQILAKVKENKAIIDDATERLDRAGL